MKQLNAEPFRRCRLQGNSAANINRNNVVLVYFRVSDHLHPVTCLNSRTVPSICKELCGYTALRNHVLHESWSLCMKSGIVHPHLKALEHLDTLSDDLFSISQNLLNKTVYVRSMRARNYLEWSAQFDKCSSCLLDWKITPVVQFFMDSLPLYLYLRCEFLSSDDIPVFKPVFIPVFKAQIKFSIDGRNISTEDGDKKRMKQVQHKG